MFTTRLARLSVMRRFASQGPIRDQRFVVTQEMEKPPAAQELIHEQPIKVVEGRVVASGGGSTGHPINFLNLCDQKKVVMCPYSGDFFVRKNAIKRLLERGAIYEKDGQYFKNPNLTDEE